MSDTQLEYASRINILLCNKKRKEKTAVDMFSITIALMPLLCVTKDIEQAISEPELEIDPRIFFSFFPVCHSKGRNDTGLTTHLVNYRTVWYGYASRQ